MKKIINTIFQSLFAFIIIFNSNTVVYGQKIVPSEILGNCVASFNVMIARRTNVDQIKSMSDSRDRIYATAINKIKIPEEELKIQIQKSTALLIRELNQKDTSTVMATSNQIWDIIGFCQKEFTK